MDLNGVNSLLDIDPSRMSFGKSNLNNEIQCQYLSVMELEAPFFTWTFVIINKITWNIYKSIRRFSTSFATYCNWVLLVRRASLIQVKDGVHSFERESYIGIYFSSVISLQNEKGNRVVWYSTIEVEPPE